VCAAGLFALAAALAGACAPPARSPVGEAAQVVDLEGNVVDPLRSDARATVLLFVRTDCPISNRYAPEIRRLYDAFVDRGVDFWIVYPGPAGSSEEIRTHLSTYGFPATALLDPQHELVQRVEATVTPEAAVFAPGGELSYRGRIDDRFAGFGQARAEPARHDLEQALLAVLDGHAVEEPRTRAVGCYIADLR
jgi:hypothetical protein